MSYHYQKMILVKIDIEVDEEGSQWPEIQVLSDLTNPNDVIAYLERAKFLVVATEEVGDVHNDLQ